MIKFFLLTFLLLQEFMPVKAQQVGRHDTSGVNQLLQISARYFLKNKREKADLDSSLSYARSAEVLSNTLGYQLGRGNSLEQISKIVHIRDGPIKGRYYANKAIEIFKASHYIIELGYAYFDLSGYYSLSGKDLVERIRIIEQLCMPAFQQAGSKMQQADILRELGDLLQLAGDYSMALSDLKRSLQLQQSIGYLRLQGTYDLMGHISSQMGDDELALKYGLLAIQSAELVKDTTLQMATIYNRIGGTYYNMRKYQVATKYYRKALSVAQEYGDVPSIIELAYNVSKVLIESNRPAESLALLQNISHKYPTKIASLQIYVISGFLVSYNNLKRYAEAQKYCDQLLNLSDNLNQKDPDRAVVYYPVTEFYLATQQYELARKNLVATKIFYKAIQSPLKLSYNCLLWFKLDSIQGKYLSAISHYKQYKALGDSLLNRTTSMQIEQLQIESETEKKDKDLILKERNIGLLTKQGQLQHSQLQEERFTKNVTLAGVGLLLIILALLYKNSQQRLKNNKQLRVKQTEIEKKNISLENLVKEKDWLVKEIHHRVKNNLHTVAGLLATQSGYLKNEEAIAAIGDSQNRVQAMSLIHQKLYQSENLSAILVPEYIHELVDHLRESFNVRHSIQFNQKVEQIELDLSHCVPLGLILNEAITNSIKYAFPNGREGVISISLTHLAEKQLLLRIADNGIGLPQGFNTRTRESMGMNLMRGLSEEIDGKFSIRNHNGTEIMLAFIFDPDHSIRLIQSDTQQPVLS